MVTHAGIFLLVSQGIVPLSRATTIHSMNSDLSSLDATPIVPSEHHINSITSRPDFFVFTSLLWIRTPEKPDSVARLVQEAPAKLCDKPKPRNVATQDHSQPELGLLHYHRDRLADAAKALKWGEIIALECSDDSLRILRSSIIMYMRCLPPLPRDRIERRKVRVMVSKLGALRIDSTVIDCPLTVDAGLDTTNFVPETLDLDERNITKSQLDGESIRLHHFAQVFLDTQPSSASVFTTHKTSHRNVYDRARNQAAITRFAPTEKEVLVYNKHGEVMEASLCTVYFYRNGNWITPAAICGGNLGVTRRLASEKGLCKQGTIEVSDIQDGEIIWLSNGARGFFLGKMRLEGPKVSSNFKRSASP